MYRDHHEAIISVEKFEAVQALIENRKHHNYGTLPLLHVVNEGIFKGYIPINHHWINDDPNIYYDISNSVEVKTKPKTIDKRTFSAFDLEGYQVVRNQFTQIRYEGPAITIGFKRVSFNTFCMKKFNDVSFVQLLLHPAERKIAIRPCQKSSTHSIKWHTNADKPMYAKSLGCPHFCNALFNIMDWNPDYLYKVRGVWIYNHGEQIIIYNLSNAVPTTIVKEDAEESAKGKRVEMIPDEWGDSFGEEFYEHELGDGAYCLIPDSEWKTYAADIPAPGIEQFALPDSLDVNTHIDLLRGRNEVQDDRQPNQ